ncbi:MAG: cysteine desulfurase [Actinomycetales bacterium]|nr:cysteine desulfurase [Actinomycetales bacterium]
MGTTAADRLTPDTGLTPDTRVFLDHAATTPIRPAVLELVIDTMRLGGNASSLHAAGRAARRIVEQSREQLAAALRANPSEVVFTASGTEANNLALKGLFWAARDADPRRRVILTSGVEHHAVLDPVRWLAAHEGCEVVYLAVDREGRVDPAQVREILLDRADEVALVSVMWANNEVGTLNDVKDLAHTCAQFGVLFHTDAVQAVGSVPVAVDEVRPDALTLSGHKLGGPIGVGALLLRRDLRPVALLHGGGQERSVRSGTLDAPHIAGLALAVELAVAEQPAYASRVGQLRDLLITGVQQVVPDAVLNGAPGSGRLPGNAHLTFPGCEGDALLMLLDAAGIMCATGSACQAGVPEPSHVLLAMGRDERSARGSLRFSLGRSSQERDVDALIDALPGVVARARRAGQR